MSNSWKDKGWKNMESVLDEAMPVQRKPFFLPIPIQLRIATLVMLIVGSAFWGYNVLQPVHDQDFLGAFDFTPTQKLSASKVKPAEVISSGLLSIINPATAALIPVSEKNNNNVSVSISGKIKGNIQIAQSETTDNLSYKHNEVLFEETEIARDISGNKSDERIVEVDPKTSESIVFIGSDASHDSGDVNTLFNEQYTLSESESDLFENVMIESSPIVITKLKTTFSIGASAGNYSFSSPNLYGQLQLNIHVPITKSFSLTVMTAAGKGLLYQNTEVLLAEYSNNPTNGTILGSEAPADDLSANVDVKSLTNALIGSQIQWQISNKWSLGLGMGAAYLFDIQHQAIQSTTLVPEGQSPQQIFTPSEITEKFNHWNHWDLRMNASLQYHMTGKLSLAMSYNRGLNNLLRHPITSGHTIQMNSLSLGFAYRF